MTIYRYVLLLLLLFVASSALAQGKDKRRPGFDELREGSPISGLIDTTKGGEYWQTYFFEVAEDVTAFKLSLAGANGDLDLYAQPGSPIDDYAETEWYAELEDWNEELLVNSIYSEDFESGVWYVDVAYQLDDLPRDERGMVLDNLSFELAIEYLNFESGVELNPGQPLSVSLQPEWSAVAYFELEVPANTDALRVDAFDTLGDIDLLLLRNKQEGYNEALVISDSMLGNESLVYDPEGNIDPGTYFIVAIDPFADLEAIDLSLVLSYSTAAPEFLQEPLAPILQSIGPHGAPIAATVQVIADSGWGSGNILSADGWILTNYHVVEGPNGELLDSVVIAVVEDPGYPAKESFRARVVAGQEHPDLALLKIEEGYYGQPIPSGYSFPFWRWGDSASLNQGDIVDIVGFPSIGGSGSRPIFTFTRGYLAGTERSSQGSTLMTDTLISGGSSGGSLTAGNGELLAIPSFTIDDENSQMSYALSLDQVPIEWKRMIGLD